MAKIQLGTRVKVTSATDETTDNTCIGLEGIVIEHNANGATGNTEDDPLHVVGFESGKKESFWFEELTVVV